MFTGIVQAIGRITAVRPITNAHGAGQSGLRLAVEFGALDFSDVAIGDSIAINGACMTVIANNDRMFEVEISRESLDCTTRLDSPGDVNLEKAMRIGDRFGGHMVSGHVDGQGTVVSVARTGESHQLIVRIPHTMSAYVSDKGSVAIDGVSLTVNTVHDSADGTEISINLISHTWNATTLHARKAGDLVNVELDQLAKQVARLLERLQPTR